jgi:intracellular sulfur oxidation DsrE/DsrF family protein
MPHGWFRLRRALILLAVVAPASASAAQAGDAPPPAPPLRIDIPIELTSAKIVYNMDRAAYTGDLPLGLRFIRLQVDSFKETGVKGELIAVIHAAMGYILLKDETYNRVRSVATGNPYRELIAGLIKDGVQIEATSVTMQTNGWGNDDLLPNIRVNGGGIPRIVQLVQEGFVQIQP